MISKNVWELTAEDLNVKKQLQSKHLIMYVYVKKLLYSVLRKIWAKTKQNLQMLAQCSIRSGLTSEIHN
jgi:hypothetical protein